jgi:hypothetical protein
MLKEFQGGFGTVNTAVSPKENILIAINDNNLMLVSKFNA